MSLRVLKLVLATILGGFLVSAAYVSMLVSERQRSLEEVTRYRPSWDASQAANEFLRFEQRLSEIRDPNSTTDKNELQLRYDIVVNRINSFIRSEFLKGPLKEHPEHIAMLEQFANALRSIEPLIDQADEPDAAHRALQVVKPFEATFVQIASLAHTHSSNSVAAEQEALLRMHWRFSVIVAGLILFGLGLIVLLIRHIQLLRRAQKKLHVLAHRDPLTGLANRALFQQKLEAALSRCQQTGTTGAVLLLDLDRFKDVNDSFGHSMGDALLQEVTERLRSCVPPDDVIGRLGGDEFAILQGNASQRADSAKLAETVVRALGATYFVEGHEIVTGTSIGIASIKDGKTPSQILQYADLALYRAKATGRGTYQFFAPEMDEQLQARRQIELDLRKALVNDELELVYQPIVSLEANEIKGFEALLRWNHPEKGVIAPGDFIQIAEETGLIVAIGRWVLHRACSHAIKWPRNLRVAVNLSPVQFRSANLAQEVNVALASSGLAPNRLELEITESVLLRDNEATLSTLHELRRMGVGIALDDFGTGFSSLSYLHRFPFDKIKIDQQFVRDLAEQEDAAVIVQSITHLGTSLRMTTTAEGVETEQQLALLRTAGCAEAQGFLFARPKRVSELSFSINDTSETALPALSREQVTSQV